MNSIVRDGIFLTFTIVQAYWYWDDYSGEFSHRIREPGSALAEDPDFNVVNIHIFHPLFPGLAMEADLLILHFVYHPEMRALIALRRAAGRPTVFEIPDNFLQPGPWVPTDDPHRNPYVRQNLLHYASLCHGLQFSSPELEEVFGFLNANGLVLENQVTAVTECPTREERFVFGWGGSKGHEQDLAFMAPAVIEFCRRHPETCFAYMGYRPNFDRYFAEIPEGSKSYTEPGPIEAYFRFVEGLHVGLAPLVDTPFNRGRSDGKYLEYAAHWAASVISNVPVYRRHGEDGGRGRLFSTSHELLAILEDLYKHPEKVKALAENANRYVARERSPRVHRIRRARFYRELIGHTPSSGDPLPEPPPCRSLVQMIRESITCFWSQRYREALSVLDRAFRIQSDYPVAHLWFMKTLNHLGVRGKETLLERYGTWEPHPIYRDLVFENLFLAAETCRPNRAGTYFEAITDPVRKYHLLPPKGKPREQLYREILEHKPFDYHALTGLLKILKRRGIDDEVRDLVMRACFIHPESESLQKTKASIF